MNNRNPLKDLPKHFQEEEKQLKSVGINSWDQLKDLKDTDLFSLVKNSLATTQNLKRLRGMASLICDADISLSEAALLLHAGIPSIQALKELTPAQLINKVGRLERQLRTRRNAVLDIKKANTWIEHAKRANPELTH